MERLPNELIDRILGYSVDHFSEMIYQGVVCSLWKKIADESLLWFSLQLKYKVRSYYIDVLELKYVHYGARNPEMVRSYYIDVLELKYVHYGARNPEMVRLIREIYELSCTFVPKELTWNPNSDHPPEPPASLPLDHLNFAFQVNTTTIVSQNSKAATELRKWFISYVIYHKKYWKWYCAWMPIFWMDPTKTQTLLKALKAGLLFFVLVSSIILFLLLRYMLYVTPTETRQLEGFLSTSFVRVQTCGNIGNLNVTGFQLISGYFENIQTLNRPTETLELYARDSSVVTFIMEFLTWIVRIRATGRTSWSKVMKTISS
jgi:hypothetical protein